MKTRAVADYVRSHDLPTDIVPAVGRALDDLGDEGGTLTLPRGDVRLRNEAAPAQVVRASNHDLAIRPVGITIDGRRNVTIDGNGCRLLVEGLVVPIWVTRSENISIKNCIIDREIPLDGEGVVVSSDAQGLVLRLDPRRNPQWSATRRACTFRGEDWSEDVDSLFCFDAEERMPAQDSHDNLGNGWWPPTELEYEQLSDTELKIYGRFTKPPAQGDIVLLRCSKRHAPAIILDDSRNVRLEEITIHHAGGMGIVGQRTEHIALRDCKVVPSQGRIYSTSADATHFTNCRGEISYESCTFINNMDDPINIHGAYFPIVRKLDARTVRVELRHFQQAGAPVGAAGDTFELVGEKTLECYFSATAVAVTVLNFKHTDIAFDADLPHELKVGDALDNISWYPNVTVRNCTMQGNRARGPLISTRGRVLIENNYFRNPGAAILCAGGLGLWCESGPVRDVTVRNNHFDRCAYNAPIWGNAVIDIAPEVEDVAGRRSAYHSNITITGNRFTCANGKVLAARLVDGLTFCGNTIEGIEDEPGAEWAHVEECAHVTICDNRTAAADAGGHAPATPPSD
jgi:hypothetical protein